MRTFTSVATAKSKWSTIADLKLPMTPLCENDHLQIIKCIKKCEVSLNMERRKEPFFDSYHSLGNIHVFHLNPEISHCYDKLCSEIFSSTNLNVSENVYVVLEVCMAARRLSVISALSKLQNIPNSSYIICTWQESLSFQYITAKQSDIKHAPCWAVRLAVAIHPSAFHGLTSVSNSAFILFIHSLMLRQVISNACQKQNFRGLNLMNLSGIQLISSLQKFERISSQNMETMHTVPLKMKHFIP